MAAPSVYAAINAVTAELASAGIPKSRFNPVDEYKYRSIDDVLNRLAPLLAKHRLCVLPRVRERQTTERSGDDLQLLINVALRVSFTLVSADDGSSHKVEAYGEALGCRRQGHGQGDVRSLQVGDAPDLLHPGRRH